ncbi:hypothetical protein WJ0W_003883 [Paenibacillus melissococcoides]|uniref:Uncharacterized protein n=1 Tax=Paenibacillus melissococcoides TaxID=2912268 RepID=A0ABM9G504_9BACL|nr:MULTISPECIES: hypothetical protein [Paenibacillus]MEB9894537.1 hypothetical protein [Bacillus cereus]CAH8246649.1 hypothetical protein WJ0W_003883 [Paenibacillus melissococcoides]CAH8715350.1 hypothetical protein HTL2_004252 [Paenibacillus melissococcoides]CAH8716299.1 hypothetical protein WDD9_004519 [Paenibacillus melissococcoides]GIO80025.1 hypothetical protein J6TS7_36350 [Paenibacillus dendritiformis]
MEQTKKGFILSNPEARAGEPVLHLYIGSRVYRIYAARAVPGTNTFYAGYVVGQFER